MAVGAGWLLIIGGIIAGIVTIITYWDDLKRAISQFSFSESFGYLKDMVFGEKELNVTGNATSTSRADVNVNMNAPKGVVESMKVATTGNTPGLNVGVNMVEEL